MLERIVTTYGISDFELALGYLPYLGIVLGYLTACAVLFAKNRKLKGQSEIGSENPLFAYTWLFPGFAVAAMLVFLQTEIRHELDSIQERQQREFKNTATDIQVKLGNSSKSGKTLLEVRAGNMVPFRARWSVSATGQEKNRNELLSGIMLGWEEFVPTERKNRWLFPVNINRNKLHSGQIRLTFGYESEYYRELDRPGHLRGEIIQRYGYDDGGVTLPRMLPSDRTESR